MILIFTLFFYLQFVPQTSLTIVLLPVLVSWNLVPREFSVIYAYITMSLIAIIKILEYMINLQYLLESK